MKKDIGFIAIGQGGGNIGQLFEELDYSVLYVNTSAEDLKTLDKAKHKHHIQGGEGCNKDRDKAKNLVVKDFEGIFNKVEQTLEEEFVFVVFTTGGGTGSGASPMLIDLLMQQTDKKIGAICVLPARNEPIKALINSYECFKELEEIEGMGATFILDNKKDNKFSINKNFVGLFDSFIGMPTHHSTKGNIDTAEIKELLSTRGASIITKMSKTTSETSRLISSFSQNIFAPMQADKVIAYIGLSAASQIDLNAVTKETGTCLDIFQGVNADNTICVLAGLTYPYAELEQMKEKVEEGKETVTKNLLTTGETKLSDGINFLNGVKKKMAATNTKDDVSDVFSKYLKK